MLNKTEVQIMNHWTYENANLPAVSIHCTAYNHERYIAKALDSMLEQETNFPFEIIVHDDASTDGTAEIIHQYESAYPHIIRPIYETKNQYSKRDGSIGMAIGAYLRGEYYAICEGDDYWCDNKKLQKQYDYMSQHSDCVLCCHNTVIHDISGKEPDGLFNQWTSIHELTEGDAFFGWNVHTSSYFYRPTLEKSVRKYCATFGDYVYLTQAMNLGRVVALPDVMSVYDRNIPTGATAVNYHQTKEKRHKVTEERINYLKQYDEQTKGRFHEVVQARIAVLTFQLDSDEKTLMWASGILKKNKYYNVLEKNKYGIRKLWSRWKYRGSSFGKLWYWSLLLQRHLNNFIRYGHR